MKIPREHETFKCIYCKKWHSIDLLAERLYVNPWIDSTGVCWKCQVDNRRSERKLRGSMRSREEIPKTVYVLGTSRDIESLDQEWFEGKYTIGINGAHMIASRNNHQLTEWLAHDQLFAFYNWILGNSMPKTRKWCFYEYCVDDRLWKFRPDHREYDQWKLHNVRFYDVQDSAQQGIIDPYVNTDEDPAKRTVLDNYIYTIFTAISLAVGLGFKDIRLRGVSLSGSHFDEGFHTNLDHLYYDQMLIFRKQVVPALHKIGVSIKNETVDAEFDILDPTIK
jgi:hypothetical protein